MQTNMGTIDRGVRVTLAVLFTVLIFTGVINGWLAIVLGVLAVVFVGTSLIGFCPLYLPFGINTCARPAGKGRV
ncbi:MAG: YgaP family membrane protein [Chloroflexaceae bacterium]